MISHWVWLKISENSLLNLSRLVHIHPTLYIPFLANVEYKFAYLWWLLLITSIEVNGSKGEVIPDELVCPVVSANLTKRGTQLSMCRRILRSSRNVVIPQVRWINSETILALRPIYSLNMGHFPLEWIREKADGWKEGNFHS